MRATDTLFFPFSQTKVFEVIPCPYCLAQRGEWCVNIRTGAVSVDLHQTRMRDGNMFLREQLNV